MWKLKHAFAVVMIVCITVILPGCAAMKQNNHTISQQPTSKITKQSQTVMKINNVNQEDSKVERRTSTAAAIGFGVGTVLGVGIITLALIGLPAAMASSFCVG